MNPIDEATNLTKAMIKRLQQAHGDDRDIIIEEIEVFLEKRAAILGEIKEPFSDYEEKAGKKLVEMNQQLDEILKNIRSTIQKDLNEVKNKRQTAERYANPYAATQHFDGYFYDKRQ